MPPRSWYFAGRASDVRSDRALRCMILGRALALFRDGDDVVAMDAQCPHLGADLSRGRVCRGVLACPYHHFEFDARGHCRAQALQVTVYPTAEVYGSIFVFFGRDADFEFPKFVDEDGRGLVSGAPVQIPMAIPWYLVTGHGFDAAHFARSHDRVLRRQSEVEFPQRHAITINYEFDVAGTHFFDRCTRWLCGTRVQLRVTVWGGNIAQVHAHFGQDETFGLVIAEPPIDVAAGLAQTTLIASARRTGTSYLSVVRDRMRVKVKRWAIERMLSSDVSDLAHIRYHGEGLSAADEALRTFLEWAALRPRITATDHG